MRLNPWKISTFAFAGALVVVTGGNFIQEAQAEAQPHMRTALKLLQDANAELSEASHDKGGYRVAARGHIAQAIEDVKKGIEFDNTH